MSVGSTGGMLPFPASSCLLHPCSNGVQDNARPKMGFNWHQHRRVPIFSLFTRDSLRLQIPVALLLSSTVVCDAMIAGVQVYLFLRYEPGSNQCASYLPFHDAINVAKSGCDINTTYRRLIGIISKLAFLAVNAALLTRYVTPLTLRQFMMF